MSVFSAGKVWVRNTVEGQEKTILNGMLGHRLGLTDHTRAGRRAAESCPAHESKTECSCDHMVTEVAYLVSPLQT